MKVAFIGHRVVENSNELYERLQAFIEKLIVNESASEFLFGSKSGFDNLCYKTVTQMKMKYAHVSRQYFTAECERLDGRCESRLLSSYESIVFSGIVSGAGSAAHIVRNEAMIDACDMLIIYYDENYVPVGRNRYAKSGTKLAAEYAEQKRIRIINVFKEEFLHPNWD